MVKSDAEFQRKTKLNIGTWEQIMITDSGTFKFTIVDTSLHTSLVLLHKQTRVSKENHKGLTQIVSHQLLQSLNFYGTMVSSTEISSMPTLLPK